ncbi:restriction endonuclease subunit S [Glutamicibacter arilaitensis]|uniref:restriction endonuclease subunit S n=1 Tax=Glutamicibacter arilaitensis TaxID=256701 RepID=UPI003FD37C31
MTLHQPYAEYKSAGVPWLDEVPAEWPVVATRVALRLRKEVAIRPQTVQLLSLTKQGVIRRDIENAGGKHPENYDSYQMAYPDDLIFCLFDIDETPRTVGITRERGMISGAYTRFEATPAANPEFVTWYFIALDNEKRLRPLYTGLRKVIQKTRFLSAPMPIPPLETQKTIASFLDRETSQIDDLIGKQERLIELLAEKRQAIITRAVTKGLDPTVPTKPSGIPWLGDIPSRWEAIPLKWLSQFTTGITPSTANEDNFPEEETSYPWIRPEDLEESGRPTEASKFLSAEAWNGCRPVRADSVLLCCIGGTLGKVGLIRRSAVTNQQITAIETEMVGAYLFATLGAARQEIKAMSVGNTLPILNTSRLGMLSVPVPPAQEQLKIAEYVRVKSLEIDLLSSKCHSAIRLLRERRSALISAAVTGKIDAREGVA